MKEMATPVRRKTSIIVIVAHLILALLNQPVFTADHEPQSVGKGVNPAIRDLQESELTHNTETDIGNVGDAVLGTAGHEQSALPVEGTEEGALSHTVDEQEGVGETSGSPEGGVEGRMQANEGESETSSEDGSGGEGHVLYSEEQLAVQEEEGDVAAGGGAGNEELVEDHESGDVEGEGVGSDKPTEEPMAGLPEPPTAPPTEAIPLQLHAAEPQTLAAEAVEESPNEPTSQTTPTNTVPDTPSEPIPEATPSVAVSELPTEAIESDQPLPPAPDAATEAPDDAQAEAPPTEAVPESPLEGVEGGEEADDVPTFTEFSQRKRMEQDSSQRPIPDKVPVVSSGKNNYASPDCGAKIIASNKESQNPSAILSENKDVYMINPCSADIWFIVELCELVELYSVQIACFELFSSIPESFNVSVSERYPSEEWRLLGTLHAANERGVQSFPLAADESSYAKYLRVDMVSHYGSEHYCPLSLLRVVGASMMEVYEYSESQQEQQPELTAPTVAPMQEGEETMEDDFFSSREVENSSSSRRIIDVAKDAVLSLLEKPLLVLEKVNIYISPPGEEAPAPEEGAGGREEKAVVPGGPGEKTVPGGPEQGKEEAAYQDTSHEQPSPRTESGDPPDSPTAAHVEEDSTAQVGGSAGAGDGDSMHEAETVSLQEFVATPTASLDDIAVSSADHSDDNSHSVTHLDDNVHPGIKTTPTINKILPTPDSSDPPSVSEEVSDELDSDRPDLTDSGSAVPSATVEPDSTGWQPGSVGSTVVDDPELDGEEDDATPLEGRGTEYRPVPSAEGQDGSEDEAVSDSGELNTESGRLSAQEVSKSVEETSNSVPEPDDLEGVREEEEHTAADEVPSAPLSVPASVAGSLGPEDKQDSDEDRDRVAEGAANIVGSVEVGRKGEAAGDTTRETLGNTGQQGGSQDTLGDARQERPQDGEESLEDVKERLNGGHEEVDDGSDALTEVEPQLGPSLDASQLEENGANGVPTANGAPTTNSGSSEEPEDGSTTRDLVTEALEEMSGDKQVFEGSSSRAEEDAGEEGKVPTPEGLAGGGGSGEGETGSLGEQTGSEQREGKDIDHGMEDGSGLETDSSVPDSTQEQNKQQQQQQRKDGQPHGSGEPEQGSLGEKALLNSESLTNGNGAGVLSGQQKEKSVFLRLSNRIRDLEENMSLFSSYLDQISTSMKRNKNRTEDSHRSLERRVSALNDSMQLVANQTELAVLALVVLYEDMQHLTHTVSNVTAELHQARREAWHYHILSTALLCLVLCVLVLSVWLARNRTSTADSVPPARSHDSHMTGSVPPPRSHDSHMTGSVPPARSHDSHMTGSQHCGAGNVDYNYEPVGYCLMTSSKESPDTSFNGIPHSSHIVPGSGLLGATLSQQSLESHSATSLHTEGWSRVDKRRRRKPKTL